MPQRLGVPDGGEVLHVFDFDTGTESPVPGSEGPWTGRWSPDGRYIVNEPNWSRESQFVYYDAAGFFGLQRVRV